MIFLSHIEIIAGDEGKCFFGQRVNIYRAQTALFLAIFKNIAHCIESLKQIIRGKLSTDSVDKLFNKLCGTGFYLEAARVFPGLLNLNNSNKNQTEATLDTNLRCYDTHRES